MINCIQMTKNFTDILTAFGTLAAVIATVTFFFYERIRNFRIRPKLQIGINFYPPDCHKTKAGIYDKKFDAYWFRLYVKNEGKSTAKDIEVSIEKVEKRIDDKWQIYPAFLLSNLVWTHINVPTLTNLLPGTMKNVDLGYIVDPQVYYDPSTKNIPENVFNVIISVEPITGYNKLAVGDYRFSIIAGAANCKIKREKFSVVFSKDWQNDETKMLNETIMISKI
jgi:hypothetical protein